LDEHKFVLIIKDDGIGFPQGYDFNNTKSLGLQLVIVLTEQLNGKLDIINNPGTTFSITFSDKNN
jgi:two-component sensor histidine kinase